MARYSMDRKALREDAYRDTMFRVVDWAYRQRKWLIGSGVAVVVVVVGGYGYYYQRQAALQAESAAFYAVEQRAAAATGEARAAYEDFLAQYPDSRLAAVAWMNLARIAWKQDDAPAARAAYEAVLAHGSAPAALRDLAHIGLAKLAESAGDYAASAGHYAAVSDQPYASLKAFNLGQLAAARDDAAEARRQFEKVAQEQGEAPLAEWARQHLDYQR